MSGDISAQRCCVTIDFKKGESILNDGTICRHLYSVNSGLAKVCSFKNGKEFIMRFFSDFQIFSLFDSCFFENTFQIYSHYPGNTTISLISYNEVKSISGKHHSMETFFRKITSDTTVRMTRRIHEMLEENSTKHY